MKTKGRREHKKGIKLVYVPTHNIYRFHTSDPYERKHQVEVIDVKPNRNNRFTIPDHTGVEGTVVIDEVFVKVQRYDDFCRYINPKLEENPELSPQQITFMWNIFKNK